MTTRSRLLAFALAAACAGSIWLPVGSNSRAQPPAGPKVAAPPGMELEQALGVSTALHMLAATDPVRCIAVKLAADGNQGGMELNQALRVSAALQVMAVPNPIACVAVRVMAVCHEDTGPILS